MIELITSYPRTSIILFALIINLFIALVNYFVLDKNKMKELKEKQKSLQEQLKLNKDDPDKMKELNGQLALQMKESFKQMFKPMMITLLPLLFFFYWLKKIFIVTSLATSWIWYYIAFSIVFSYLFRKLFKMNW